ncbi:MAG: cation-translocating P-type ATPase [Planctomycetota bacterium]
MTSDDDRSLRARLGLVCTSLALGGAWGLVLLHRPSQPEVASALIAAAAVVIAWPILWSSLVSPWSRRDESSKPHLDRFVALAVAACLATERFETAWVVSLILVVGELLEDRSVMGAQEALESLLRLSRSRARRVRDGREEEVDASDLVLGDHVRVLAGESIPADGRVHSGASTVDQSHITGESVPEDVEPGASVFAGSTNLTGTLALEVTHTGDETVIGRVRKIVEEAQQTRAPVMRVTEEYARYYAPMVLLISGFVLFMTRDLDRAIAVLIVSIPCAFLLAGPTAMVAALAAASRSGILVKSVRFFEATAAVDTVVFDKTGTLTTGKLAVQRADDDALSWAAALARHSAHPVSRAVAAEAEQRGLVISSALEVVEEPGRGLRASADGKPVAMGRRAWLERQGIDVPEDDTAEHLSVVHVAVNDRWVGSIGLADTLRDEARPLGGELRELGVDRVVMLTGDREGVARAIAEELEIEDVRAECLPEEKQEAVNDLKAENREVLVLGDGVNDAPALAAGDVGIAMHALGSDVALRTADVALMSGDLTRLPEFIRLSRRTVDVINQNLMWGVGFIGLFILASSFGYIGPIAAAVLHELSAFFVIFNSARLLRWGGA